MGIRPATWPLRARLLLFAFGDFAFNLYWQSIMLFLLFYYTDALALPVAVAGTIFMIASIWDGLANFAAGILADRRGAERKYGRVLMLGSVPLGLSFILAYMPPALDGAWGVAAIVLAHLVLRTAYALVNVPYLAMTARISVDSRDRAFIAGMRMFFGTGAAVIVALTTVPLGAWLTGTGLADAFFASAMVFAALATAILLLVGWSYEEVAAPPPGQKLSLAASLGSLFGNRAFVTLNLAMMAVIVAITVLHKSVLYYYKYYLGDAAGGQLALAGMSVVSALAIPLWMLLRGPLGTRSLWFVAVAIGMAALGLFALFDIQQGGIMQLFLMGMQAVIVGLNFVFWTLLPDTIEYGEQETGLRVEGTVFGLAALLQRVAIGVATAILGWSLGSAGYVANVAQSAETLAAMRRTITIVPLAFLAFSCILMLLNPLGRRASGRAEGGN